MLFAKYVILIKTMAKATVSGDMTGERDAERRNKNVYAKPKCRCCSHARPEYCRHHQHHVCARRPNFVLFIQLIWEIINATTAKISKWIWCSFFSIARYLNRLLFHHIDVFGEQAYQKKSVNKFSLRSNDQGQLMFYCTAEIIIVIATLHWMHAFAGTHSFRGLINLLFFCARHCVLSFVDTTFDHRFIALFPLKVVWPGL